CTFALPLSAASVMRNFACDSGGDIGFNGSPAMRAICSDRPPSSILCTELRPGYGPDCCGEVNPSGASRGAWAVSGKSSTMIRDVGMDGADGPGGAGQGESRCTKQGRILAEWRIAAQRARSFRPAGPVQYGGDYVRRISLTCVHEVPTLGCTRSCKGRNHELI